ncbi:hypothetical protein LN543_02130, partial [Xanthomonas hortorum pv. gardneri]|nr:hypothetical protein [Xanthomonas hortorum pv. gardneri]
MDSSKILPYVVATLLGSAASLVVGTAVSQSWCNISSCTVYPPILTNPGGGGGGGGGWGGSSTDPNTVHCSWYSGWFTCTVYTLPPQVCVDLYENLPANCDLTRPPPLTVNGCGSTGTDFMPDYLVTAPALQAEAIQYGNIFTAACNIHDQCYGTF